MFLYHYLTHPKTTGAIAQSSSALSSTITRIAKDAQNIIELGAGSGAFTKEILQKMPRDAKFFAIEINPKLAHALHLRFPNLDIALGSVELLEIMMEKRQMQSADAIISGIPWSFLSAKEQLKLLKIIHSALAPKGVFATFAYHSPLLSAKVFRHALHKTFTSVKTSKSILFNIPPAFVYFCEK